MIFGSVTAFCPASSRQGLYLAHAIMLGRRVGVALKKACLQQDLSPEQLARTPSDHNLS
jgi:hypothetical protein